VAINLKHPMKLADYQTLIQSLPTHQQAFTTKRATWEKTIGGYSYWPDLFPKGEDVLQISRKDIFDTKDVEIKILKTIMWGYPRGMRGKHFSTVFQKLPELAEKLKSFQGENLSKSEYEAYLRPVFDNTRGLGLSTYSKLLYFFEVKIDSYPCLILDERLLLSFRSGQFEELKYLTSQPKYNPSKWYVDYLRVMHWEAQTLKIKPEKLEQFLFLFAGNLKP
jgi:hypothetical protein